LFLGLAALPAQAQAQYPSYYYPQPMPMYGPAYPYGYPNVPMSPPWQYAPRPVWVQPPSNPMPVAYPSGTGRYAPDTPYPSAQVLPAGPAVATPQVVTSAPPAGSSVETLVPLPPSTPDKLPPAPVLASPSTPTIVETVVPQTVTPAPALPEPLPAAKDSGKSFLSTLNLPSLPRLTGLGKESKAAPTVETAPALTDACGPECCKPTKQACVMVFGESLYWSVHGADVPFAQAFDGTDPFASVPRGPVASVSPTYEWGYRGGVGVALSDTSWLVGTFTYFRDASNAGIVAPDTLVLHNTLVFPNTVNSAGDSLTSNSNYVLLLETGDVDYKCAFVCNDHLTLNWLAGARYAHLQQGLTNTSEIFGSTTIDSHIDFDGYGPRAGLEGEYKILGGFYGYGKGVANLLVGKFKATYEEDNVFTGLVGQTSIHSSRVVPVLEMELGFGWRSPKDHIRVSAGYYVGSWFNTLTTNGMASAIGTNNFTTNGDNFRDTITFDGVVGHVEFRY